MKKKYILYSLILLLILIPFNAKAYTYKGLTFTSRELIEKGYIQTWPDSNTVPYFYVGNSDRSYMNNNNTFTFHSAINNSNIYLGYSGNIGFNIGSNNSTIEKVDTFKTINNNSNNLTDDQRQLLEDLIINGYHYDQGLNTRTIESVVIDKSEVLSVMAMQILTWEIMEGGRTSFSTVAPNSIASNKPSYYTKLVYPNGGESNQTGTLYYYYKKIVDSVNDIVNSSNSIAFNTDVHSLSWDGTNRKYGATIPGLGKYTTCRSSDSKVTVSTSGSTAVVSSNEKVDLATISCSYAVGGGTEEKPYYFKFRGEGSCASPNNCSSIIYGSAKKVYTKSFGVSSKTSDIIIKNVNAEKKAINGAIFKLTHRTTTSYTFNINANSNQKTNINKSGEYIVSEISSSKGYEKISDFNIKIDTSDSTIKDCTNKGQDSNGNTTCLNGRITVTKENDTIVLTVTSLEKNFKIIKINENKEILNGASFQIRNNKNEAVKFKNVNGVFTYDTTGSADLYQQNSGTFAISMLPAGEYSIVETKAPSPYRLNNDPTKMATKIQIDKNGDLLVYDEAQKKYNSAINSSIQIKNYRTLVKIVGVSNGNVVKGASYSLYPKNSTTKIKATNTQSGVYSYSDNQSEGEDEFLTNEGGYIYLYDLPIGSYQFKNNSSPNSSPIDVVIDITKDGPTVNGSRVINTVSYSTTKNSFSFYKTDEDNNYLGDGKFKLQKYDEDKGGYRDVKLVEIKNDGSYNEKSNIFKPYNEDTDKDKLTPIRQFTLTNGIATFVEMTSGTKYRIVEVKAPKGYALQEISDTATVELDSSGNAYGLLVLTNKKVSASMGQAQAELIINIDTGQTRIKYAIVIVSIVLIIGVLFLIQKKKK